MKESALNPWNIHAEHLDLATTFFSCHGSAPGEPIGQWQGVITCPGMYSFQTGIKPLSHHLVQLFENFQQEFWNMGGRLLFDESASLAAKSIVVACDFNPETTTAAHMDSLNPVIECCSCEESTKKRTLMSWRRGVLYAIDHTKFRKQQPIWRLLDPCSC